MKTIYYDVLHEALDKAFKRLEDHIKSKDCSIETLDKLRSVSILLHEARLQTQEIADDLQNTLEINQELEEEAVNQSHQDFFGN